MTAISTEELAPARVDADRLQALLSHDTCPFCGRDPYHYVDIGVGMQRVAVNCCDLGIALIQYGDEQLTRVSELLDMMAREISETRQSPTLAARVLELEAAQQWQPIETAPYDTEVTIRVGSMSFPAILQHDASMNAEGESCDQWLAANEGEHPPCWSGGCCWESNENDHASMQPDAWQPRAALNQTGGAT